MKQVNQVKLGAEFIKRRAHRESHDRCLWEARMRRDKVASAIPEWEQMRELASEIKLHTLTNLDRYLEQFIANAEANGIHVHRARDAREHNEIILDIFRSHGVRAVTKGKSMTMDECGMREYMEAHGIEINEADLGERIQQLDRQRPSHIVMPAIHKLRSDVAELFARTLGSDPDIDDPHYLNSVMRADMRQRYVKADAGMTGVNFGIAETGGIVVCSNEGNADISATLPPLFVATMGMEKIIPRQSDLPLFIRLLSRSALGLDITQYTSHFHGPRPGQEMHLVILDNGRSKRLASPDYWQVLKCIRCGACMNTCPVFRRTSGISYDATYMGPIGIVLEPSYDLYKYARLPYSCTHCGSCGNVCPVKVPIPQLVFYWRSEVVKHGYGQPSHNIEQALAVPVLKSSANLAMAEKVGLWALRNLPAKLTESRLNPWAIDHTNPEPPKETFRQYYARVIAPQAQAAAAASPAPKAAEGVAAPKNAATAPTSQEAGATTPQEAGVTVGKARGFAAPAAPSKPASFPLPAVPMYPWPGDPLAGFVSHLEGFDGKAVKFATRAEALRWLAAQPEMAPSQNTIYSTLDDVTGNFGEKDLTDLRNAEIINTCVTEAEMGVGEMGSVWVTDRTLRHPACALMSRHLFVLLDATKIVGGIHQAYARLSLRNQQYGSFFTGPSATADIEAVHITGAQGPLSMTVLLYNCKDNQ